MRLSKGFTSFVGMSLSRAALLIPKRFICWFVVLFLSTVDTIFLWYRYSDDYYIFA